MRIVSYSLALLTVVFASPIFSDQDEESNLIGDWVLNEKLTEELRPPVRNPGVAGGFGRAVLGTVGIPLPGGSNPAANSVGLRHPIMLECEQMSLTKEGDEVLIECANGTYREFQIGNEHGRRATWKSKRMTESYRSTSRTVRHDVKLEKSGNLIVTVTIKPKGGTSQKYVRAFDPKPEPSNSIDSDTTEPTSTDEIADPPITSSESTATSEEN